MTNGIKMRSPSSAKKTVACDLAANFAAFASSIELADLSDEVVTAVKANILDTLACAIAGSSAPAMDVVHSLVTEWQGAPQATTWVFGESRPAHHVAWLNGGMAHARDYDDTHDAAILHAGISTVPAAIAAAELRGDVSGADLIAAVAAGLEITTRLGTAITVDIVESGFIYSSLLGYFGATAAAGRAFDLTEEQMWDAFGIVYSSVAGNHQVTRDASLMKRLQPSLAAQAAVVAVQLAARGIRGARNVFEGEDGFVRVYLQNRFAIEVARNRLGERFELLELSYKPYPCCRDTHSAIDAALQLRESTGRSAEDIVEIRVGTTGPGYQMVCVPEEVRRRPSTVVEAQFSIPYTVAAAYIDGRIRMEHFAEENIARADLRTLAAKVKPYVNDEIDRQWHRSVPPALVEIDFIDGHTAQVRVDHATGHPLNPMTADAVVSKIDDCFSVAAIDLPEESAQLLRDAVNGLDTSTDVAALVDVLAPSDNSSS